MSKYLLSLFIFFLATSSSFIFANHIFTHNSITSPIGSIRTLVNLSAYEKKRAQDLIALVTSPYSRFSKKEYRLAFTSATNIKQESSLAFNLLPKPDDTTTVTFNKDLIEKSQSATKVLGAQDENKDAQSISTEVIVVAAAEDIFLQINSIRSDNNLPELVKDEIACSFANLRAQEISENFSHTGFRSRFDSGTLAYPSYSSAVENIAMNENPEVVFDSWMNSEGHKNNMLSDITKGCVGASGQYYTFEGWKP
jgi:uncharacterized protein YkwD